MFETKIHERDVNEIERQLDVQFPQSYRQFLLQQGSTIIAGFRILGILEEEREKEVNKKVKKEELDLSRIAEDTSCSVCKRQKQKGKITCYPCYNQYSRETKKQTPLSLWVKDELSSRGKEEEKEKERSVLEATENSSL